MENKAIILRFEDLSPRELKETLRFFEGVEALLGSGRRQAFSLPSIKTRKKLLASFESTFKEVSPRTMNEGIIIHLDVLKPFNNIVDLLSKNAFRSQPHDHHQAPERLGRGEEI